MSLFLHDLDPRRLWHVVSRKHILGQRGQATTEYALILLVAAVIATLVIAWATFGGGSGRIGELFDTIFDGILQRAEPGTE